MDDDIVSLLSLLENNILFEWIVFPSVYAMNFQTMNATLLIILRLETKSKLFRKTLWIGSEHQILYWDKSISDFKWRKWILVQWSLNKISQ